MTRSIVFGGIVGIAIGAIITFAVAHGVLELSAARAETTNDPPPHVLSPDDDNADLHSAQTSHRPLRPGGTTRGALDVGVRAHAMSRS